MNALRPEDFDTAAAIERAWARFWDESNAWHGPYGVVHAEVGMLNGVMYRGLAEKQALIERFLLSPPQDQPAQPPATGEDPAVELQRSFFEIPGFMQPPQRGGS